MENDTEKAKADRVAAADAVAASGVPPAEQHEDDDRRIAQAREARVETPEGRAAREAHDTAMKGQADAQRRR